MSTKSVYVQYGAYAEFNNHTLVPHASISNKEGVVGFTTAYFTAEWPGGLGDFLNDAGHNGPSRQMGYGIFIINCENASLIQFFIIPESYDQRYRVTNVNTICSWINYVATNPPDVTFNFNQVNIYGSIISSTTLTTSNLTWSQPFGNDGGGFLGSILTITLNGAPGGTLYTGNDLYDAFNFATLHVDYEYPFADISLNKIIVVNAQANAPDVGLSHNLNLSQFLSVTFMNGLRISASSPSTLSMNSFNYSSVNTSDTTAFAIGNYVTMSVSSSFTNTNPMSIAAVTTDGTDPGCLHLGPLTTMNITAPIAINGVMVVVH